MDRSGRGWNDSWRSAPEQPREEERDDHRPVAIVRPVPRGNDDVLNVSRESDLIIIEPEEVREMMDRRDDDPRVIRDYLEDEIISLGSTNSANISGEDDLADLTPLEHLRVDDDDMGPEAPEPIYIDSSEEEVEIPVAHYFVRRDETIRVEVHARTGHILEQETVCACTTVHHINSNGHDHDPMIHAPVTTDHEEEEEEVELDDHSLNQAELPDYDELGRWADEIPDDLLEVHCSSEEMTFSEVPRDDQPPGPSPKVTPRKSPPPVESNLCVKCQAILRGPEEPPEDRVPRKWDRYIWSPLPQHRRPAYRPAGYVDGAHVGPTQTRPERRMPSGHNNYHFQDQR